MRWPVAMLVVSLLLANVPLASGAGHPAMGAAGCIPRAATLIYNVYELQNMSLDLNGTYELANDIDARATAGWNGGAGFMPVGNGTSSFNGSLDGKNHSISGLFINRPTTKNVGLFGCLGNGSSVKDTCLVDINVTGYRNVGGLVGSCILGSVNNISVKGTVSGIGRADSVGGLAGYSNGTVSNSSAAGNVTGLGSGTGQGSGGSSGMGGLIGNNAGTISHSHAASNVTTTGSQVGGLAGVSRGLIRDSHAAGNVTGNISVGGLVGTLSQCDLNESYATGSVTGSSDVGGLVGSNMVGNVHASHASGDVTGNGSVGGLVGNNKNALVSDSYSTGDVDGTGVGFGGLVGLNDDGTVDNSFYNRDDVLIRGAHLITAGGLFDSQYRDWLLNGFALNISEYRTSLVPATPYYDIINVQGLRDLLGFAGVPGYKFRLAADLDLSNDSGLYIPYLRADFDGGDHTISHLRINLPFVPFVGMFGFKANRALKDIGIVNATVTGYDRVGGLVGYNYEGEVNNSYSSGNVTGYCNVGGLIGYSKYDKVDSSHYSGNVAGQWEVGGLAGFSAGTVCNSHANADVTGLQSTGGLVGTLQYGIVNNSYATGAVHASIWDTGGLVGISAYGQVVNSHATGNVTGGSLFVGGLVGRNYWATISNSYANGTVAGKGDFVGGLAGESDRLVTGSHASGDVTGRDNVGGLLGSNSGSVYESHAFGDVKGNYSVGGLVGFCDGYLQNVSSEGDVAGNVSAGGLVGLASHCRMDTTHATGNVHGNSSVGGLVGELVECSLDSSFAAGDVSGVEDVGGLVGFAEHATMTRVFSVGDVAGNTSVGGLIGFHRGWVHCSYAWGSVEGEKIAGGLVGSNHGGIDESYSTGAVEGDILPGGLVGWSENDRVFDCFWDTEASGRNASSGGAGRTTAAMKTVSTFTAAFWDFNDTWYMVENATYPLFKALNAKPQADAGEDTTIDEGAIAEFDGSRSLAASHIVNFTWTFTDRAPVRLQGVRPQYRFADPGSFVVTLEVIDAVGNRDTDSVKITVRDITTPVADAGSDQVVNPGSEVAFNGRGSSDNIGIVNYSWSFTDGAAVILYGVAPTYLFCNSGSFVVRLTVTDAAGNRGTDHTWVHVRDTTAPVAEAGPDLTVDEGTLTTLDAGKSRDKVAIAGYEWTFLENFPVTLYGIRPSYRFEHPGTYVVTLKVTDTAGNRDADTMTVTVRDITEPAAEAGPDRMVDEGTLVAFDGSRSSDNVGIVNYSWLIADGAAVALHGVRPEHRFVHPGRFAVTLTVTDAAGHRCTDTMTVTVNDRTAPVAEAGPDRTVDEGATVTFDGSKSSDNAGIDHYTWTFSHGSERIVLHGISPSFTFSLPGVYPVTLNVSDAAGFRHGDAMTLTVRDITPPVADAGPDRTVLFGSVVGLDGSLSKDNVGISRRYWNFTCGGRAHSLEGERVPFRFDRAGVYEVALTVIDAAGNRGEDTVVITVVEPRTAVDKAGSSWPLVALLAILTVAGIGMYLAVGRREGPDGDGPSGQ